MKKILYLLSSNTFSGAENVICTIINNLDEQYDAAYCSPFGPIESIINNRGIKYIGIPKINCKNLKKIIKEYKPDIIHANDYKSSVIAALSGFKGTIISHLHSNCEFSKTWNLKTLIYNYTISRYSKIIGVSDKVYEDAIFREKMKNKYITIYNYINEKEIIEKSNQFLPEEEYDLFFLGRLNEEKNPQMYIEIINRLKEDFKQDISCVMIGDGNLRDKCRETINKYNLQDNITMTGFLENPYPIIKNCKIGILPSKWEGFGLAVVESMILKKPVLNSGVGGLKEICANNNEFICENDYQYIEKIKRMLNDNKYYEDLVSKTVSITKKFTNKEKYIKELEKVYN